MLSWVFFNGGFSFKTWEVDEHEYFADTFYTGGGEMAKIWTKRADTQYLHFLRRLIIWYANFRGRFLALPLVSQGTPQQEQKYKNSNIIGVLRCTCNICTLLISTRCVIIWPLGLFSLFNTANYCKPDTLDLAVFFIRFCNCPFFFGHYTVRR
jgi:hypothetical protein